MHWLESREFEGQFEITYYPTARCIDDEVEYYVNLKPTDNRRTTWHCSTPFDINELDNFFDIENFSDITAIDVLAWFYGDMEYINGQWKVRW